jgi:hypothetical protein
VCDYRADLGINMSYQNNFITLLASGLLLYVVSYFLLKHFTVRIAP